MSRIADYLNSQPTFSSASLIRLHLQGHTAGWLEPASAKALRKLSASWQIRNGMIQLVGDRLASELNSAAQYLHGLGLIKGWRNENYGVCVENDLGEIDFNHPICALERASFRRFGLTSRAVHINAYYPDGSLCLGHRAASKSIDPSRLDNMAAGGIPIDENIYQCALRELFEEAGVPVELAKNSRFIESIRIERNEIDGTHNEVLYCFDLALPEQFEPKNQDGEVAQFYRLKPESVIERLGEMTWDAGRVSAGYLLRHGWK
jgi:8-oxo-dGTP pyrophosphatase MutT (NUDIX family)